MAEVLDRRNTPEAAHVSASTSIYDLPVIIIANLHTMAWRMCLRQKITLQTSWELLQERCGFSESEFALFKDLLISHMKSQKNRVGLQGPWPIRRRSSWERWLNRFIDDGIGNQYWGEGTTRKWSLERERDQ